MRRFVRLAGRGILGGLIVGVLAGGFLVFAEYAAWQPWGSLGLLAMSVYAHLLVVVLALLSFLPLVLVTVIRPARWWSISLLTACTVAFVICLVASGVANSLEKAGIRGVVERSEAIVRAIASYQEQHGSPPESLETLVPRYLAEIPSTGSGAYPSYHYSSGSTADAQEWQLSVGIGSILFDFTHLDYDPARASSSSDRYGDWVVEIE